MSVSISLIGVAARIKDDATLGRIIGSLFCDCDSPTHVLANLQVLIRELRQLGDKDNYVDLLVGMATSIKDFEAARKGPNI